jgi:intein/homing endonuclease
LANGTRVPISEVKEGDYVYATDPETGESGPREVLATLPHTDQLLILRTSSGEIVTTEDHRYWNATDQEWQESQDLDAGDRLLTVDGDVVTVEGLDWSTVHTDAAYDLDIADVDTFYVGAGDEAVLVHNCGVDDIVQRAAPDFADGARSPGAGWEWRGSGAPGSGQGNWYNATTRESLHPDLSHGGSIGGHYDYKAPDGTWYRWFSDGRVEPK